MNTKTEIENLIDTIDTGGLNSALEVRNVLKNGLVNALYSDSVSDTHTTTNAFTRYQYATQFEYSLTITKLGNKILVSGAFRSTGGHNDNGGTIAISYNNTYKAKNTSSTTAFEDSTYKDGINRFVGVSVGKGYGDITIITYTGALRANNTYRFSCTYISEN